MIEYLVQGVRIFTEKNSNIYWKVYEHLLEGIRTFTVRSLLINEQCKYFLETVEEE